MRAVLGWPLDGWLWRLLLLIQNVLAVAVLAGIAYALVRRVVLRPARLTLSRDGVTILWLIGAIVVAELLAEGFRLGRYGDPDAAWAIVANPLGGLLAGVFPPDVMAGAYVVCFAVNVLLVCWFLAYLPRSKHLHIATAVFNTAFRKLRPRGELPPMDLEAETARFGVKTIEDLSWKDLLDGLTCTECGRCQDACPAWATGKPLNPKTMIMGLRGMAVEAEEGVSLLPWLRPRVRPRCGRALIARSWTRRSRMTRPGTA